MGQRSKTEWFLPVAAFLGVIGFGVGVIATAAYDSPGPIGVPPASAAGAEGDQIVEVELGDLFIKPVQLQAEAFASRSPTVGRPNTTSRSKLWVGPR